ncbi:MAG: hypothetical protein A2231_11200 [Candidatus Firestonebacteria bacterium RIFOXYA2_FULL_40_8]|nr:MAG: hypothetical protein A2231_11200 [Candidatus Firestonebacteria bacterium RIFOXYA2_FULL_40_8]
MKKKTGIRKVLLVIFCLFFTVYGYGFGVSPAVVCLSGVEVGEDKDTGLDYTISNDAEKEQEYTLEVLSPIMPSDESLKGYSPLPDLTWIYLERTTVVVPGKSTGKSRIHIKIPKDDKYYNQHWAVSCHIKQKGNSFVTAAVAPFLMIETKSKESIFGNPYGEFGIVPSIIGIDLKDLKTKKVSLKIYNNSVKDCTYKISSFIPDAKTKNAKIGPSDNFEWINEAKWVKPEAANLKIKKGENKEVEITITLPDDFKIPAGLKGLEALIFIEAENKEKRFIRVLLVK